MAKEKKYNRLKLKLSNWALSKGLKNEVRNTKVCSLKNAKTVGVTFAATSPKILEDVKKLLKDLASKGIQTFVLAYIPEKKPSDFFLSEKAFNFFYDKELDWLLRPSSQAALEFQNFEFDILIDFGSVSFYPMKYLLSKSKAKFKIGYFINDSPFDLMMDINPDSDSRYYFDQVLHYLDKFN